MKAFFTVALMVIFSLAAFSQVEREEPQSIAGPQIQLRSQRILGKVLDEQTGRGLQVASIQRYLYLPEGKNSLLRGS